MPAVPTMSPEAAKILILLDLRGVDKALALDPTDQDLFLLRWIGHKRNRYPLRASKHTLVWTRMMIL